MAKQDPNLKISPAYRRKVEMHLEPEAIQVQKQKLVEVDNRLAAREALAKKERKNITKELNEIKQEQAACLAAINSGTIIEETEVKDYMYLQTGSVQVKRVDNGAVVDERPMTDTERQTEMFAPRSMETDQGELTASIGEQTKAKRSKKAPKDQPN